MKLTQIKEETCPSCGAAAEAETRNQQHCNGYYNESRTFACGARVEFVPNFMACSLARECPHSEHRVAIDHRRAVAYVAVRAAIQNVECDDQFKNAMLSDLKHREYDLRGQIRKLTS